MSASAAPPAEPSPAPSTAAAPEASKSLDKRIGFLGAGQMAEALARGLMARHMVGCVERLRAALRRVGNAHLAE